MTLAVTTKLPPGPAAPALVQTMRLVRDPIGLLEKCRDRWGDAFTLRISGYGPLVHLSNPDDLRTMFNQGPDEAHAGEPNHRLFGAIAGRNTSLTLDGQAHIKRRRAVTPAYQGDRMTGYISLMEEVTKSAISAWPTDVAFSLHEELQKIALEVILRAVFGLEDKGDEQIAHLRQLLARSATEAAASPLLLLKPLQINLGRFSPWGKVVHLLKQTRAALDQEIARRRSQSGEGRTDILAMLLRAKDEEGRPLSNEALRDELIVQLLAGHETTASALAWSCSCLLESPDSLGRLRTELATNMSDSPLDTVVLEKLVYLDAVIKESMRLRPIMPTAGARLLRQELQLSRYRLPAGVFVANSEVVLHRHPNLYESPLTFAPERFLNSKPPPYTWMPFGGGGRRCLGMAFALTEMKVVLATIFSNINLSVTDPPVRIGKRGFFIAPHDGPRVRREPRSPVPQGSS